LGSDIDGESNSDRSGWRVSLNGNGRTVAIGAIQNDGATGFNSGHTRVYQYSGGSWSQVGSDIDGEASSDFSGIGVSMNDAGDIVAIASDANDGAGNLAGHVRVFQYSGSSWTQVGSDIDGESGGDQSGFASALSSDGNTIVIGAPFNGGSNTGHARIYSVCGENPNIKVFYRPSSFGEFNISEEGASDGMIRTLLQGGTAPYTYTWTGPTSATGETATGLDEGSYYLEVEDANGCTGSAGPWYLSEPPADDEEPIDEL